MSDSEMIKIEMIDSSIVEEVDPLSLSSAKKLANPSKTPVKNKYKCKSCEKEFNHKSTLSRHKHTIHNPEAPVFICAHCNRKYKTKTSLIRHHQNIKSNNGIRKSALVVNCALCDHTNSKSEILFHYEQVHNVAIEKEIIMFSDLDAFYAWKSQTETETIARYVKIRKDRLIKDGTKEAFFRCHRDGMYKPRGKKIRGLKKIGSNKINGHCPAKMQVWINKDQKVSVMFVKTHVGHEMELHRLTLTKVERDTIAKQLALQVPFEAILDEVKDSSATENMKRMNLLTRKDLYNIESSYSLTKVTFRNCIGANADSWVQEMIQEHSTAFIRFYKPQGHTVEEYPQLTVNDFQLVIMNDVQTEILRSGGNDCLCIDTTVLMNDYVLITVVVLDERDQGFPCAFLVTNNTDIHILEQFFETIKEVIGCSLKPRLFMSNLDDCFYCAWTAVMPTPAFRIYSPWVVDSAWKNNLSKIKNEEKQKEYLDRLIGVMEEVNVQQFEEDLHKLHQEMKADPDTDEFADFFEEYKRKTSSWAHCFRTHLGLNVNYQLEQVQKALHLVHSCRDKKVFQLDKFLFTLMARIKETRFDALISMSNDFVQNLNAEVKEKHKIAMELPKNLVTKKTKHWHVGGRNAEATPHRVRCINADCNCYHSCLECMTCVHAFICSCVESTLRWTMCIHVHLVGMRIRTNTYTPGFTHKNCIPKTGTIQTFTVDEVCEDVENPTQMIISVPESAYQYMAVPTGDENNILLTFETDSNDERGELILTYDEEAIEETSVDERRSLLAEKCQNILNKISSESQVAAFEQAMANLETEVVFIE